MWIFLNDSFLSIVAHRDKSDMLLVRARMEGDIEALFPNAQVRESEGSDYKYRADVPTEQVAEVVAKRVKEIDYGNFKDSVREPGRHEAYMAVWQLMGRWGRKGGK